MCELPSVYSCDVRTSRKEHVCCECRGKINAGEKYHYHHGIWDGRADDFKVCTDCEAIREVIDEDVAHPEDRTAFGELWETVFESRELKWIAPFMETRRKRGAKIEEWMTKLETKLKATTP